ncbi:MAG: transcription termination/antitermination protein NusG [bacterium]
MTQQLDSSSPQIAKNKPVPTGKGKAIVKEEKKPLDLNALLVEYEAEEKLPGSKKEWFVIHTYSGYEDRVAKNLSQRIESMDMHNKIFRVVVPTEATVEYRSGKKRSLLKKMFPGYVLVNMVLDDDSWFVVRNTPSVIGFTGSGGRPTSLSKEELKTILTHMGMEAPKYNVKFKVGDVVDIKDGPFAKMTGKVVEIDDERGKVKVLINMFGRETPVEIDIMRVK